MLEPVDIEGEVADSFIALASAASECR